MKCKECGQEFERLIAKDLCQKCYGLDIEKRKLAVCIGCGETKPIKAKGMCRKCYMRFQRHGDPTKTVRSMKGANLCSYCHEKPVHAKRLCGSCYARYLHHGSPQKIKVKRIEPCKFCGSVKVIVGKDLCANCYQRASRNDGNPEYALKINKVRPCGFCGVEKKIVAKGLCNTCYQRYQKNGTPEYSKVRKVCSVSGCENLVQAHDLCQMHYARWRRHSSIEQTRGKGWGARTKHPLNNTWHWLKRKRDVILAEEWKDFWTFVEDVGERPSPQHKFYIIDPSKVAYKDNYEWSTGIVQQREGESESDFRIRYGKRWRRDNGRKTKEADLQKHYNITLDEYHDMLERQNGVCAICKNPEYSKDQYGKTMSLAVDHDHVTGEIRGLLCVNCNGMLGHGKDSPEILKSAIQYLT